MSVDDRTWISNVEQLAGLTAAAAWEPAAPRSLQSPVDAVVRVAGELTADITAAVAGAPLEHDPRLRAWALLELLSVPQLQLLRRLAPDAGQTATLDAAEQAVDVADALRILRDGLPDEPYPGATNFDDAVENLLRMAAGDLCACLPSFAGAGEQRTAIVTAAFEGHLPADATPRTGEAGDEVTWLTTLAGRLRACSHDVLTRVSALTFAEAGTELAATIDSLVAPIPPDAAPGTVWPRLYRLLDDASLHSAAASRRHDAAYLRRALRTFERGRRWLVPFATVEQLTAAAAVDTATPAAVCGLAAGHLLWATRDHMASRQLTWLPRVHEPGLLA